MAELEIVWYTEKIKRKPAANFIIIFEQNLTKEDLSMNTLNNSTIIKEQYKTASNLNTRISIHAKYSTNKESFGDWIVSNYKIKDGMRILELGCGTGDMWKGHLDLLENETELVLTDFSEGMLQTTRELLGENGQVSYQVVDIQNIPFEENSFDMVIANMMLYHVPDLAKGLAEVRRVLKPAGSFYCATYGEHGIVEYIEGLLKDYLVEGKINKNFTLQNGAEKLSQQFAKVERLDREDGLAVTEVQDMVDYIYSLSSMSNISNVPREELQRILEANMVDGVLYVPKEYGMFVCHGQKN